MADLSAECQQPDTDEELVRLIVAGDKELFSLIYDRHYRRIFRIAYGMTGNFVSAQDLSQEIFIRAFQQLDKFSFLSKFSTWFYRLAYNYSLNYRLKTDRREDQMPEDENLDIFSDQRTPADDVLIRSQLQSQIHTALLSLKPKLRLVVILRDIEGLTYEEVGEQMNLSTGTVASRLNKARSILSRKLCHLREVIQ